MEKDIIPTMGDPEIPSMEDKTMPKEVLQRLIVTFMESLLYQTAKRTSERMEKFCDDLVATPFIEAVDWDIDLEGTPVIVTLKAEWVDGDIQTWTTLPAAHSTEDEAEPNLAPKKYKENPPTIEEFLKTETLI
jgi:hypothetical protein